MEPMALGSSPSSPSTPTANPNYLPAFLMGQSNHNTPLSPTSPSPDRSGHLASFSHSSQKLFGSAPTDSFSSKTLSTPTQLNVSKPGPPKQGLFDSLDVKTSANARTYYNNHQQSFTSTHQEETFSPYPNKTLQANTSYNTEVVSDELNSSLWVTVFGFSSSAASIVLARFLDCGTIVEKRSPTQGNWIHLKFSSQYEAAKALTLNGKLISNAVMVGVIPYNNRLENKENVSAIYTSPIRARPLRQSFSSPHNNSSFMANQNTPQKSTGMVTKAMEYVFGW